MANKLLTIKEVSEELYSQMLKECGEDLRKQRAWAYDMQTAFGAFPSSEAERKRYIETGKT